MRANSPGAFSISLALHAAAIATIFGIGSQLAAPKPVDAVIFDLVDLEDVPIGDKTEIPGAKSPKPGVKFKAPKAKPLPAPPKEPEAARPAAKNTAKNTPAAKPAPNAKTTTYAEFAKQNKGTLEKNRQANAARSAGKAPKVDADRITKELQEYARGPRGDGGGTGGTKLQVAALDAYVSRLVAALKAAFATPDTIAELPPAIPVSFYIASDGSLSAVRVLKSSGHPELDQAIIEAFRSVRSIGPVPGGKGGTWQITFRLTDD